MNTSNELNWDASIWKDINEAVLAEVMKVRAGQKVFPTIILRDNPTEIPNDVIEFQNLSIKEGQTKQLVELYHEFPLTSTQVSKEAQLKTCKTLARMAAKAIAVAEDTILFQGKGGVLPQGVKADLIDSSGDGLLGHATPPSSSGSPPTLINVTNPIQISKHNSQARNGLIWGENIFSAVAEGIATLTQMGQAPKFALFLPTKAYADTFVPPSAASLVTTAERIKPLVEGGFIQAVAMPEDSGLLVALAGEPTSIYVGQEATTEFVRKEGSKFYFRVVERVQYVARDPRAFVKLTFQ